jgi:hypothetical protein
MKLIKDLWIKNKTGSRWYRYGLFICDNCGNKIEKIIKDWIKAKVCSHKCYAENRWRRWPYKHKIMINKYRYIYNPEHPRCINWFYVAEHRLVIEKHIWRYLLDTEIIHHIDGDTLNNNINNLQIMTASEHSILHCNFKKNGK